MNEKDSVGHESDLVLVKQDSVELDGSDTSSFTTGKGRITDPYDPTKIEVSTKNAIMDVLIKRLKYKEIDLAPAFQRGAGIWSDKAQSRLIESMLIRIPLPAFYMDATDDRKWLVVDGLQRLTTLYRFVVEKSLKLSELEFLSYLEGQTFDDLDRDFQRRIEETPIVIYLIQPGTPPKVKFDIFRRINTGGMPLSSQEIRHALNQGKVIGVLKSLAESEEFKAATDNGVSSKRMDDRECVLRFLVFSAHGPDEYTEDNFDGYLNDHMAILNKESDAKIEELSKRFRHAMTVAKQLFGNDAFRKRYRSTDARHPINKALFESWAVNLGALSVQEAQCLVNNKEKLNERFMEMMKDTEFDNAVTQGTGSINRVQMRFSKVKEIIKETLA